MIKVWNDHTALLFRSMRVDIENAASTIKLRRFIF